METLPSCVLKEYQRWKVISDQVLDVFYRCIIFIIMCEMDILNVVPATFYFLSCAAPGQCQCDEVEL